MSRTLALVAIALAVVASVGYIVATAIAMRIHDIEPSTVIRESIPTTLGNALNNKAPCNITPPVMPPSNMTPPMMPYMKRFRGGFAKPCVEIEVSEEFKQKVIEILKSDPDASSLLAEGYNITSIKPIIRLVVQGDGSIVMKATKAIVLMVKPGVGKAIAYVDIERGVVEKLVKCETKVKNTEAGATGLAEVLPRSGM